MTKTKPFRPLNKEIQRLKITDFLVSREETGTQETSLLRLVSYLLYYMTQKTIRDTNLKASKIGGCREWTVGWRRACTHRWGRPGTTGPAQQNAASCAGHAGALLLPRSLFPLPSPHSPHHRSPGRQSAGGPAQDGESCSYSNAEAHDQDVRKRCRLPAGASAYHRSLYSTGCISIFAGQWRTQTGWYTFDKICTARWYLML